MTISEQIISVFEALAEQFGIAINWGVDNVVPYIKTLCDKLIQYEIWTSIGYIGLMVLLCLLGTVIFKNIMPKININLNKNCDIYGDEWMGWMIAKVFLIIFLVGLYITTITVIAVQAMDIIKCKTFPEMYIFEYIQDLITKNKTV